jgi:hypothetical protein
MCVPWYVPGLSLIQTGSCSTWSWVGGPGTVGLNAAATILDVPGVGIWMVAKSFQQRLNMFMIDVDMIACPSLKEGVGMGTASQGFWSLYNFCNQVEAHANTSSMALPSPIDDGVQRDLRFDMGAACQMSQGKWANGGQVGREVMASGVFLLREDCVYDSHGGTQASRFLSKTKVEKQSRPSLGWHYKF